MAWSMRRRRGCAPTRRRRSISSCCTRRCGSPRSSTGRWTQSSCAMPATSAAAPWTAEAWRCSKRRCRSSSSPGCEPTEGGCCATSRPSRPTTPPPSASLSRADVGHAPATVCMTGPRPAKREAAAAAGFGGVELFEPDLSQSGLSGLRVRRMIDTLGLRLDLFQPFRDFEAVAPAALARNLKRAETPFEVMAQLRARTLLVCSNVSPDAIDDDALAAEQLHALASRAEQRGMRVAYEALAWGRNVSEYDHAWRIVRAADHPALGVWLDSFHILALGPPLHEIVVIPADKLFFCQRAAALEMSLDVREWSRHHRRLPGQGT